jgi:hypothetical protein
MIVNFLLKRWKSENFSTQLNFYITLVLSVYFLWKFFIFFSPGGLDLSRSCLDRRVSTVEKISTVSKSASRQLRNLGLDRDFSILSRHQCRDQKVSIEIKKFVKIWKFWSVSTVCLDLDREVHGFLYFLIEISQSVETFHHFQTQKASTNLDCISTNLDNLDVSRQSRQKSQRVKVSTEKSQF